MQEVVWKICSEQCYIIIIFINVFLYSLTQVIRRFAKQLDEWLIIALDALPGGLQKIKFDCMFHFFKCHLQSYKLYYKYE